MRKTKSIILELGSWFLKDTVVRTIVKQHLVEYGATWDLQRMSQWEVNITDSNINEQLAQKIEKSIIKELNRLSRIYWDLEILGVA